MKQVYHQDYTNNKYIACYVGKPPKKYFEGDVIRLHISLGDDIYITPDEASTLIRALSAGLSHYLVKSDKLSILKNKYEKQNKTNS